MQCPVINAYQDVSLKFVHFAEQKLIDFKKYIFELNIK